MTQNRQWILRERPVGLDFAAALKLENAKMPVPADGDILMRTQYMSLDPANRLWMRAEPSYRPPIALNGPMEGGVIGRVVESRFPGLKLGDYVSGVGPWADYAVVPGASMVPVATDATLTLTTYLSVVGFLGWTAYFGLLDVTRPKAGETLVVSGAAGAVGNLVGQIGKIKGCRVIGIAGSDEKCAWLTRDLGFDAAINYKTEPVETRVEALAPRRADGGGGVDIYFENVGGDVGNAVLRNLATGARVSLCGLISQYNADGGVQGLDISPILYRRATLRGFLAFEFIDRAAEANAQLTEWIKAGKLKAKIDVVDGLENTLTAFGRLFVSGGEHAGKLMVKVDPDAI